MSAIEPIQLLQAGRSCPTDYVYSPSVFARAPDFSAEVLYVVGGLYGNLEALAAVKEMAALEPAPVTIVFNGDFHWFDAEANWFAAIESGVSKHRVLRGNVETEIARRTDIGAGCGCAYPESVSAEIVTRSNDILNQLRGAVPVSARARLRDLPMHLVAGVGPLRIGIVHGDAAALAGWRFAHDELDNPKRRAWLTGVQHAAKVDVFASTHTCLAALRDFDLPDGRMMIINNGAAGMPNFSGTNFGVITRIATTPSPHAPLYGLRRDGVHVDTISLKYDHDVFLKQFLARWPRGSPAHGSYFQRIVAGPDYSIAQAARR